MRWRRVLAVTGLVTGGFRLAHLVEDIQAEEPEPVPAAATGAEAEELPSLRRGDRGIAVVRWQDDLNEWIAADAPHLAPVAVDGVFGPATEAATRAFQDADARVPTDLVVDAEDQAALAEVVSGS
ncbi:MAG TPA: peptidoglycan-binding domain-containing protein [Acidimicrobiales bacterium]